MKIGLVGYGKMGKAIEQVALQRGHTVPYRISHRNRDCLKYLTQQSVDVAIEFSQPEAAYKNIYTCLQQGVPVIAGTTGWLDRKKEIEQYCREKNGTFFYATNFSLSVHIFFKLNSLLANYMDRCPDYEVSIEETHHTTKKDQPSGTAIQLAEGIIQNLNRKKRWICFDKQTQGAGTLLNKQTQGADALLNTQTQGADTLLNTQTQGAGTLLNKQTQGAGTLLNAQTQGADTLLNTQTQESDILFNTQPQESDILFNTQPREANAIPIISHRIPESAGTHVVQYKSMLDTLEIKHIAHSRESFAQGVLLVAEWIRGKKGVFGMDDFMKLENN
jgi:4-hydroxy-tetrahydrodipicolinate reductase